MLRDRKNDLFLPAAKPVRPQQKPVVSSPTTKAARNVASASRATPAVPRAPYPDCKPTGPRHVMIKELMAKHSLRRLSTVFGAWRVAANEGRVNLQGAARMLQWRKLLRIWKVLLAWHALVTLLHYTEGVACMHDAPHHSCHQVLCKPSVQEHCVQTDWSFLYHSVDAKSETFIHSFILGSPQAVMPWLV